MNRAPTGASRPCSTCSPISVAPLPSPSFSAGREPRRPTRCFAIKREGRWGGPATEKASETSRHFSTCPNRRPRTADRSGAGWILVVGALVKLHASDQIPHIASALLRLGPAASFATAGLRALGDFDTEEGWSAFLEIARSSDPAWRRNALGAYSRMDRLPPQVAAFCLQELDDEDRDARGYACTDLMGSTYDSGRQRYPALYALLGNPCTDPMRVELIRDAVEGRPLPSPAALGRPTRGPRPYLAPGLYADPSASPSVRQQLMFGPRLHLAPGLYGGRNIAPPGAVVPPAPTQP